MKQQLPSARERMYWLLAMFVVGYGSAAGLAWLLLKRFSPASPILALVVGVSLAPTTSLIAYWKFLNRDIETSCRVREVRVKALEAELERQREYSRRCGEAEVKLLSAEPLVRLGGVSDLESLVQDSKEQQQRAVRFLCAFVTREGAPIGENWQQPKEVAAAFSLLCKIPGVQKDLRGGNLAGLSAIEAHLENAALDRCDLTGCDFSHGHFEGAKLFSTRLSKAILKGASFSGAEFHDVRLSQEQLASIQLTAEQRRVVLGG